MPSVSSQLMRLTRPRAATPGAPLGDAPMAYLLWHKYMKHNPKNSLWANRDRFVLSNGHASAMLYSLLHLAGYKVSIEDLKQFRQWGSITPGHPEYHHTDGIEVTTGPLGQGFAASIGMAAAEKHLAAVYNKPDYQIGRPLHVRNLRRRRSDGRRLARGSFACRHSAAGQGHRSIRRQPDLA